ncbi:tRNA-binding protein [Hoyosella rhizosphaerae]|uniref:Molecular chaperone CsaA n=1 Tax=Hoyosella rhizosphaerae TaxID=1755582 RepID=A0A916U2Z4_9ACTN|nr:tRNA-binding protein [Hoyosella rhizosphaerae]MBN4926770.1 tRNA-binding protein [Hoyosella rhizosphaerae]GGC56623.1 molecular chaperone CsaA [Hoyosella rhizosphaerae]
MNLPELGPLDLRIGTVVSAYKHPTARIPAYVLTINLGELGTKTSSAQITDLYDASNLVGRQVICVCNLEPKRIGGVTSEVLTIGAYREDGAVSLIRVDHPVADGTPLA